MKSIQLIFCISFAFIGCKNNSNSSQFSPQPTTKSDSITVKKENILANVPPKKEKNYVNPVILPNGSSLVNLLKAYYLTGQFDQMMPFFILKNGNREAFHKKIQSIEWGYSIKLSNCQWSDNHQKFILTYIANINNTKVLKQYQGEIINDTAKIYFNCGSTDPFVIH